MSDDVADSDANPIILAEYDEVRQALEVVKERLEKLIEGMLERAGIAVHSVNGRVKGRDSLVKKLERPDSRYTTMSDVHDVVGLRVITHFDDEVSDVESLLSNEFYVDHERSGDRGDRLAAREFGYRSVHLIAQLDDRRRELSEYEVIAERVFEIQIRSILQHAWAEIEHDLGYKNPNAVPDPIRRRFSRVAAFLEVADEDFSSIRRSLEEYEREITKSVAVAPEEVEVNAASLRAFMEANSTSHSLDQQIADTIGGAELIAADSAVIEKFVSRLEDLGVERIDQVATLIRKKRSQVLRLVGTLASGSRIRTLQQGVALYYLMFALLSDRSEPEIRRHLDHFRIGPPSRRDVLFDAIQSLSETPPDQNGGSD